MKNTLLIATLATLVLSAPFASAADNHSADKGKKSAMHMSDQDKQAHMSKMQESMLKMHEQMHKIMEAKTPHELEQHKQAHLKIMQDSMQMMHGMKGGHGMAGDAKEGMKHK